MITTSQIERWLQEDLGHHDVTNDVPGETIGRLTTKAPGVIAGLDAASAVFDYLGCESSERVEAGTHVESGTDVLRVAGPATSVLRGERVAVNLVGHASGIATRTRHAVEAAERAWDAEASASARDERNENGLSSPETPPVRIAATRKTTPGLRGLEKRAVVAGGGDTHRLDLSHMVLIKDNHVAELGLETAISHFRERVSFATKIEVEVETAADALLAADAGVDVVMLDNVSPAEATRAVSLLRDHGHDDPVIEVSGGITLEAVPEYATTGVDVISMGSLTHSAPALDLSFRTGE